ncbi:MAG TPA: serine--tRNA ligase [Planctomycetota bacterium]|nr:serine--tRNA ligase [Planctomycetota bacterium]
MLDPKFIAENRDLVKRAIAAKHEKRADVEAIVQLNDLRRKTQTELDNANHESKKISEEYRTSSDKAALGKRGGEIKERIKALEAEMRSVEVKLREALLWVPNIPHESVPVGDDAAANKVEKTWGERKKFAFKPKPHWEIGTKLGILDEERAAKISGSNFLLLKGAGARLERALITYFLEVHTKEHGYTEIWPPYLVNAASMLGTAQLPKLEDDTYQLERDKLFLIPTAEVPVTNLHRDETLKAADLPIRYAAYTACFRREAGAYGRDTRGMVRIHQFDKVEMVRFAHPDKSWAEHEELTRNAETLLERLGLEYRRVLLSTGDMSFASAKTFDLEVWAPGVDRWLEVSSCSNFTDFQARRMNCRFRDADGKVKFVHTLNGSGLALPRTVIAILENYQREDGSVEIPEVLQPYLGGHSALKPN